MVFWQVSVERHDDGSANVVLTVGDGNPNTRITLTKMEARDLRETLHAAITTAAVDYF